MLMAECVPRDLMVNQQYYKQRLGKFTEDIIT